VSPKGKRSCARIWLQLWGDRSQWICEYVGAKLKFRAFISCVGKLQSFVSPSFYLTMPLTSIHTVRKTSRRTWASSQSLDLEALPLSSAFLISRLFVFTRNSAQCLQFAILNWSLFRSSLDLSLSSRLSLTLSPSTTSLLAGLRFSFIV